MTEEYISVGEEFRVYLYEVAPIDDKFKQFKEFLDTAEFPPVWKDTLKEYELLVASAYSVHQMLMRVFVTIGNNMIHEFEFHPDDEEKAEWQKQYITDMRNTFDFKALTADMPKDTKHLFMVLHNQIIQHMGYDLSKEAQEMIDETCNAIENMETKNES